MFETTSLRASAAVISLLAGAHGALAQQAENPIACNEGDIPALAYGSHASDCELGPSTTDSDSFSFEGEIGDNVRVTIIAATGFLDPSIVIFDPTGSVIVDTFCSATGCAFTVEPVSEPPLPELTAAGTYFITVSDEGIDNTGTYTLQVERILPPPPAPTLGYDEEVTEPIDPTTDVDFLDVHGTSDTHIRFAGRAQTGFLDPRLEIRDPGGAVIADIFCSETTCSFEQELAVGTSGSYLLSLSDVGTNNTGNFQLGLHCVFGPCDSDGDGIPDANPPQLLYDVTVTDTVSSEVDADRLTFEGVAGSRVRLSLRAAAGFLDPRLDVRDPDGNLVLSSFCSPTSCSFNEELDILADGTYWVEVFDQGWNNTGTYQLHMHCLLGGCQDIEALPLVFYDTPFQDDAEAEVDIDGLRFYGQADAEIRLNVFASAGFIDPRIEILNPDDSVLLDTSCSQTGCSFSEQFVLPADGFYRIYASDQGSNNTGTYRFNLQCLQGDCDGDADGARDPDAPLLAYDTFVNAPIDSEVEMDYWAFHGTAGNQIELTIDAVSNFLDPRIEIIDPNGIVIHDEFCDATGCAFSVPMVVATTGFHTVFVSDQGSNHIGDYDLALDCVFPPGSCSNGPPRPDDEDNCVHIANGPLIPDAGGSVQRDTDGDGFGNICDPDFDQNCTVDFEDLGFLKMVFFTGDPDGDMNGDGSADFEELALLKRLFLNPPGPSGTDNDCGIGPND